MNGSVDLGANLVDLIFSVEISTNNVVSLNKLVKLSLEILVLLGEQEGVLLKSLQLRLEVKVAVHESLV